MLTISLLCMGLEYHIPFQRMYVTITSDCFLEQMTVKIYLVYLGFNNNAQ